MTKKYQVLWSEVAEGDLKNIIDFIAQENPAVAKKILRNIKLKTNNLFTMPQKGRVIPELLDQGISTYRELIVPPWRIIYKIEKKIVLVFSVLDGRRNIEDILLRRLISISLP